MMANCHNALPASIVGIVSDRQETIRQAVEKALPGPLHRLWHYHSPNTIMTSTAPQREGLFEASLRQGQIRHALKTALACCLATGLTYFFHLAAGEFAPIFVVIIMALGMPSPRLNAILGQFAIAVSAVVSALLLITFHDAPFLYLSVTLVWIFTCLLFTSRFPLPGSMGSMVSAIGIFVFSQGT